MNRFFPCSLLCVFALFLSSLCTAQVYPAKAIRFVIPFAPGGNSDRMARMIGQKLTESWGQAVIIDNRTGAGGTIGADAVAKAPPDGYTLLMGSFGSIGASRGLYKNLPYDPIRDFAPVTLIATPPLLLVIHPSLPVASVKDVLALA
jgi:tripartite-type tricarboxylate transporter receptor subunit TctC